MGRLAGFSYREIVKRLKVFGFSFDRQAAAEAMKSGIMNELTCIPPYPIMLEIFPRAQQGRF